MPSIRTRLSSRSLIAAAIALSLSACSDQKTSNDQASSGAAPAKVEAAEVGSAKVAGVEVAEASVDQQLNEWFEAQYESELLNSPMTLTSLGRKDRYGEIDDMSEAADAAALERRRKSLEEMKAKFDRDALSDDAKLSYDLWEYQYNLAAEGAEFRRSNYVFNQMNVGK